MSDDYPDQTASLSDAAFRTHTEGLCWTMRRETDGHIVSRDLRRFAETEDPDKAAAELVRRGYWEERSDGWQIVHHMEHQPESDVIRKRRENDAERQRRSRRKRAGVPPDDPKSAASDPAPVDASRPGPTRPDPGHADCHAVTDHRAIVHPEKAGAEFCERCGVELEGGRCPDPWHDDREAVGR